MKDMIRQLLESADPEKLREDSFVNYHAVGLNYLCLHRDSRLTVKIYLFTDALKPCNELGWLVWPHNHRYAFQHVTLSGDIGNISFRLATGDDYELYAYATEKRSPVRLAPVGLRSIEPDYSGTFSMWDRDELHTLIVHGPSIAAQIQYHDDARSHTMMVAERGRKVECASNTALYHHPWAHNVKDWIEQTRSVLS